MYIAATSNDWQEYYCRRSAKLQHGDEMAWLIFDRDHEDYDGDEIDKLSADQKIDGETFDEIKLQLEGLYGYGRVYLASDYRPKDTYWGNKSYKGKFRIAQRQILEVPEDTTYDELFTQQLINTVMAAQDGIVIRKIDIDEGKVGVGRYDAQFIAQLAALVRDYKIRVHRGIMKYNPKAKSGVSVKTVKVLTPEEKAIYAIENNFDGMDWHKFSKELDARLESNVKKQIKVARVRAAVSAGLDWLGFSTNASTSWFDDTSRLIANLETLKQSALVVSKAKAKEDIKALEDKLKPHIRSMVHIAWKMWATGGSKRNYNARRRDASYKTVLQETFPKLLTYMPSLKKDFDESWVKYKKKFDDKPVKVKKESSNVGRTVSATAE